MTKPMHETAAELALCAPVEMLQAEAVPEGEPAGETDAVAVTSGFEGDAEAEPNRTQAVGTPEW